MFKILIVDDESVIRRGIRAILQKGIEDTLDCIEAANGLEALSLARDATPNLIITDISMPGYTGLDFISALREENNLVPVIILSGYENFEYAKSAIKLGVKEYIMKPVSKEEFLDLIKKYIYNITEETSRKTEELNRKLKNERTISKIKQDVLRALMQCADTQEARQYFLQLSEMGMTFESKLYTCAVVEYKSTFQNEEYIDFAVKNVLDECLSLESETGFLINVPLEKGRIVSIFEGNSVEEMHNLKKRTLTKAVGAVMKYCDCKVYIGAGEIAYDTLHLHTAVKRALIAASFKIYEEPRKISIYEERENEERGATNEERINWPMYLKEVEEIDASKILKILQEVANRKRTISNLLYLQEEYVVLQSRLNQLIQHRNRSGGVLDDEYKPFGNCWSLSEMKRGVRDRIARLKEVNEGIKGNAAMAKQVQTYIDEHITENIDLNSVANVFQRTPGYISTIFKQYTKEGFHAYLTKERMHYAKKMLVESSMSIHEISKLCGYGNQKYFSVVFRKMTEETPREYRANHQV